MSPREIATRSGRPQSDATDASQPVDSEDRAACHPAAVAATETVPAFVDSDGRGWLPVVPLLRAPPVWPRSAAAVGIVAASEGILFTNTFPHHCLFPTGSDTLRHAVKFASTAALLSGWRRSPAAAATAAAAPLPCMSIDRPACRAACAAALLATLLAAPPTRGLCEVGDRSASWETGTTSEDTRSARKLPGDLGEGTMMWRGPSGKPH